MQTNQNTPINQSAQDLESQLDNLLKEAEKTDQEIDEVNRKSTEQIADLDAKINGSINNIGQICSDLNRTEKEAGDDLDRIILEQAENLAEE